ncbi:MAG TPA: carboxypeptidase-like regulatory domain-containing protein, partial [Vicinamibacteria bacterium]
MAEAAGRGSYTLHVPLDVSKLEDVGKGSQLKVVVADARGGLRSQVVSLEGKGVPEATFHFEGQPGATRVLVGPPDASDEEMTGLQTLALTVSSRHWAGAREVRLGPVAVSQFYWAWWRRWCRTFTITGRVICPDGRPVPGASVCAFDVDWWWWWTSSQQVGCATTDASGAFTLTFRWCCGWWPWWWWRYRYWQLEPWLAERIVPVLQREPRLG